MANNRLMANLTTIRQATDTLRVNLINGGLTPTNNDTLPELVSQVPALYSEPTPEPLPIDEWRPDPLWVFEDPNGGVELKNIKQIYDEDALASSYTYRAIFMINGAYPTTDLRAGMTSAQAITYILSDGTTYSNLTGTSTIHTWDTNEDVIDSNGNPVRYIRCYSNTNITNVPNFNNTIVWVIYNLGTVIPGGSGLNTSINFSSNHQLQSVDVMENITTLNQYAFSTCRALKYCDLLNSGVTSIPDGVRNNGVFYSCSSLKTIKLRNEITSIGIRAFNSCSSLKEITLPTNLQTIGESAFYGCSSLISINIPSSVQTIGESAFHGCSSLKTLIIPDGVTGLLSSLCSSCYNLISINIPSNATAISNMISTCYSLVQLTIPFDFNLDGLNLSDSSNMSVDALVDILNNLKDLTGETAKTITFGTKNKGKLTSAQIEIATNKNWTVA